MNKIIENVKNISLDNTGNAVAIIPTLLTVIDATTGGLLTLGAGLAASTLKEVILTRHNQFEKDLQRITDKNKLIIFLQKMAEDEELQSYFSEYVAKNCQTPSIRARNAMVIICKKMINGEETLNHFTKTAMNTLMQLTDEDIAVFLVATDEEFLDGFLLDDNVKPLVKERGKFFPEKPLYPFVLLREHLLPEFATAANCSIEYILSSIEKLVICFGLATDPRLGGGYGGKAQYGINEYTRKLREVLLEEQHYFA